MVGDIADVALTSAAVPGGRQATALALSVVHRHESTVLPIVIKATKGFTGFRFSSPAEMRDHLAAVRALRGTISAPVPPAGAPAESPTPDQTPGRRELARGISSVTMNLIGAVAFLAGLLAWLAMLPFGILTWTHVWVAPPQFFLPFVLTGLFAITVGRLVFIYVPARVRAELRAGYTLSRGGDTGVDQLDQRTGYVIRAAGSPALSREGERREKLRVRALADQDALALRPARAAKASRASRAS